MADSGAAELRAVAKYFRAGQARMIRAAKPVVTKAAVDVKRVARANLGGTSMKRLKQSVTYDLATPGATGLGAEIGPDQGISGLGLGREFGSSGTPPHPFLFPAADVVEPKFADALEDAVADAWEHVP